MGDVGVLGGTPTVLYDEDGNSVQPAKGFEDGGDHFNNIPWEHAYLHIGERYRSCSIDAALATSGVIELVVTIGSTHNAHMVAQASAGAQGKLEIYEGSADVVGGAANPIFNRNRESALTTDSVDTLILNPTSITDGTFLDGVVIPGGSGGNAVGGTGPGRDEFILKRDLIYLFRFTNLSVGTIIASLNLDWYDHLPVGTGVT